MKELLKNWKEKLWFRFFQKWISFFLRTWFILRRFEKLLSWWTSDFFSRGLLPGELACIWDSNQNNMFVFSKQYACCQAKEMLIAWCRVYNAPPPTKMLIKCDFDQNWVWEPIDYRVGWVSVLSTQKNSKLVVSHQRQNDEQECL